MSKETKLEEAGWLTLTTDEEIIRAAHPSIWPALREMLFGLILVIGGVVGTILLETPLLLIVSLVGLVLAIQVEIRRRYRWYVLTTEQVWKKSGVLRQNTTHARYDDIENINLNKGVIERLLNFGDLELATSGTGVSEFRLENVPSATQFKGTAIEQLDIVHERKYYQSREDAEEVSKEGRQSDERS